MLAMPTSFGSGQLTANGGPSLLRAPTGAGSTPGAMPNAAPNAMQNGTPNAMRPRRGPPAGMPSGAMPTVGSGLGGGLSAGSPMGDAAPMGGLSSPTPGPIAAPSTLSASAGGNIPTLTGGSGAPGMGAPNVAGANVSGIQPGANDLYASQITPQASGLTAQAQGAVGSALGGLSALPDRTALMQQQMTALGKQLDDQRTVESRQIGQQAAALGRVGSGMTTSQFGDLNARLDEQRTRGAADFATQAAQGETSDRLARLNAGQSVLGQSAGLDASNRNELRTERGYQAGLEGQAYDRQVQQTTLADQLQNSALGRALGMWSAGTNSGNLTGALSQMAGMTAQNGGAAMGSGISMLGQWAREQGFGQGTQSAYLDPTALSGILGQIPAGGYGIPSY